MNRGSKSDAVDYNGGPLVSIVTPCLNPGGRLERCIESVAGQTYCNIEHLIVDGGSTDGTVDFLRDSSSVRWVSEYDHGQTQALNKGFRMAEGEVLTWLNADDLLTTEAVKLAIEALHSSPGAGWVYGNVKVVEPGETYVVKPPRHVGWGTLGYGNRINQPGTFFMRWAFDRIGGRLDEDFNLAMDFDLWLRFLGAGVPAVYLDRTLATFEIHPESKTGRVSMEQFTLEEFRVFLKLKRIDEAAVSVGRAAAYAAEVNGKVERSRLADQLARHRQTGRDLGVDRPALTSASARTQAAILEARYSILGLRHAAAMGPWIHGQTRTELLRAVRARITRRRGSG